MQFLAFDVNIEQRQVRIGPGHASGFFKHFVHALPPH
jgi:hypothetical protein